ncbi:MAG: hypothetical protein ABJH06_19290 [Paraglaciecola sp.]|uniref:hypothetical protein n=1 Tax=Paraglaciecola sp. TaxID=1920173 RepID=UPI003265CD9D
MKPNTLIIVVSGITWMLMGCVTKDTDLLSEALLEQPSMESRQAMEVLIGEMLKGRPIKLADTVFSKKSRLTVERQQSAPNSNNVLNGREIAAIDSFTLFLNNGQCMIRHNQTGQTRFVENVKCITNP